MLWYVREEKQRYGRDVQGFKGMRECSARV